MKYLLLLLFTCCAAKPEVTHFRGISMTMPYHIQVGQKLSKAQKNQALEVIQKTFDHINLTYNSHNPLSELTAFNQSTTFDVSNELLTLIELSKKMYDKTNHLFDPTLGKGLSSIMIKDNHIEKPKHITLDLDGIAKGHGVDLLTEALSIYPALYVNWGGDIRVKGEHPEKRPWKIFLAGQDRVIEVKDIALATSGTEFQPGHIINPQTLERIMRAEPVTILAPTCAEADARATAALIQNYQAFKVSSEAPPKCPLGSG